MNTLNYKPFYRRNLPHIQPPGATFFVTFRLAGSLPQAVLSQWQKEKQQYEAEEARLTDEHDRGNHERKWQRRWFRRFEVLLDQGQAGRTWLKDEQIAMLVAESLRYRDNRVYRLDAYCIMPNHVHVVFAPLPIVGQVGNLRYRQGEQVDNLPDEYYSLASILHSLKRYTAQQANRILGRNGAFWEHESYDHCVRDEHEWKRIVAYVLNNPVKAKLVQNWKEWQWSYCRYTDV